MSFAASVKREPALSVDKYEAVVFKIKELYTEVESSLPHLSKMHKNKRHEVHLRLQTANKLASRFESSLEAIENTDKSTYSKWKKEVSSYTAQETHE